MNQINIKISVIIPVYNVEKYLEQCIKSVVTQTYEQLEIILVDDGSTDNSGFICESWKERDKRIQVIHKTNGGLSDARNVGLDRATGDYIAFVDSDDFIENNMYEIMLEAAVREKADLVCCGRYLVQSEIERTERHCLKKEKQYSAKQALREILYGRDIEEAAWDKLYKKEIFDGVRYPLGEINEDIVVIPQIINKIDKIVHVGIALYNYRVTANSITKSKYTEKKSIYIKHIEDIKKYVSTFYPDMKVEQDCFVARYSYAELLDMSMDKDIVKQYKIDYQIYKKNLRKSYQRYIKYGKITFKDKIQIIFLLVGIYGPVIRMKKYLEKKN